MSKQPYSKPEDLATYAAFMRRYPDADQLIRALCAELVREIGPCATLNPAIGYVLRQRGLRTIIVTGEITCPTAPLIQHIDAKYHLWILASDGISLWHIDAANPFQLCKWYSENLAPDQWSKVARGEEPSPYVPIKTLELIWGKLSSYGITLTPGTLSAEAPFFDVLEKVGKRDIVCELFRSYGFDDPYEFTEGVLNINENKSTN